MLEELLTCNKENIATQPEKITPVEANSPIQETVDTLTSTSSTHQVLLIQQPEEDMDVMIARSEPPDLSCEDNLENCRVPLKLNVGTQCNTRIKCLVSVEVQTDVLKFNQPVLADKAVQFDGYSSESMNMTTEDIPADNGLSVSVGLKQSADQANQPAEDPLFMPTAICHELPESPASTNINDEESDSDFTISGMSTSEDSDSSDEIDVAKELINTKKYLVFESQLDKLFTLCPECSAPITSTTKQKVGSLLSVKYSCINGHSSKWDSQPLINAMPAGNLILSAAILFSGNTYSSISSFSSFCGMSLLSETKFYDIQKLYLWPIINNAWEKIHRKSAIDEVKKSGPIDLCGDGRADSPGHNAKYGTYTMMEESSGRILDTQVVQVSEVTSSNAMEPEGCNRCLNALISKKVKIRCLATDRHTTVTSNMRKLYPKIKHQYDTWHLAKWVVKKLTKKAKTKGCEDLNHWIQSISNHLWWSAATCGGNATVLMEKWTSIIHHVTNKHSWGGCKKFKKCVHHRLTRREVKSTDWIKAGSPSHQVLLEVVFNKRFLKDLQKMTEFHHTGELEVFHSLMLKYLPKREHFSYRGMVARTQLAAMDHNFNLDRSQAVTSNKDGHGGQERYKVVFPKGRKNWVAKPMKKKKSYKYVFDMLYNVVKVKLEGRKVTGITVPDKIPKNIAPMPRPEKNGIIARHKSRFGK